MYVVSLDKKTLFFSHVRKAIFSHAGFSVRSVSFLSVRKCPLQLPHTAGRPPALPHVHPQNCLVSCAPGTADQQTLKAQLCLGAFLPFLAHSGRGHRHMYSRRSTCTCTYTRGNCLSLSTPQHNTLPNTPKAHQTSTRGTSTPTLQHRVNSRVNTVVTEPEVSSQEHSHPTAVLTERTRQPPPSGRGDGGQLLHDGVEEAEFEPAAAANPATGGAHGPVRAWHHSRLWNAGLTHRPSKNKRCLHVHVHVCTCAPSRPRYMYVRSVNHNYSTLSTEHTCMHCTLYMYVCTCSVLICRCNLQGTGLMTLSLSLSLFLSLSFSFCHTHRVMGL